MKIHCIYTLFKHLKLFTILRDLHRETSDAADLAHKYIKRILFHQL